MTFTSHMPASAQVGAGVEAWRAQQLPEKALRRHLRPQQGQSCLLCPCYSTDQRICHCPANQPASEQDCSESRSRRLPAVAAAHADNPLLQQRGNAGSHDVALGTATLRALRGASMLGARVPIPRQGSPP